MMTSNTVQQLLQVFRNFRDNHASGIPLQPSYQKAVTTVAEAHSVRYQTIGDACRRRFGLKDIDELYELLAAWVKGNSHGLVHQVKENSNSTFHVEIDQFFSCRDAASPEAKKTSSRSSIHDETEIFQFRLPKRNARMLKALAELEGISAPELIAQTISVAVRDRMAVVARGIIKNAEDPCIN